MEKELVEAETLAILLLSLEGGVISDTQIM